MLNLIDQTSSSSAPPVFSYPSNTNVANFVNIKLDAENRLLWEDQILNLIDSHGFRPFINGTIAIPPMNVLVTMPDQTVIEKENADCIAW